MNINDLFHEPYTVGDLADYGPEINEQLLGIIQAAHVKGKFSLIADSENDGYYSNGTMEIVHALERYGDSYMLHSPGGYFMGVYGKGWFTLGVGCPLQSAGTALFMDESLAGTRNTATVCNS